MNEKAFNLLWSVGILFEKVHGVKVDPNGRARGSSSFDKLFEVLFRNFRGDD